MDPCRYYRSTESKMRLSDECEAIQTKVRDRTIILYQTISSKFMIIGNAIVKFTKCFADFYTFILINTTCPVWGAGAGSMTQAVAMLTSQTTFLFST